MWHTLDSIHDIMDALSSLEKDSDRLKQDEEELDKRRIGLRRRYFEIGAQLAGWLEARDELKKLQGITVLLKQLDHQTPSPGQE